MTSDALRDPHPPSPADQARRLLEENLPLIERLVGVACRRCGLVAEEGEEFHAHVRLQLLEDDCARLREFRGQCPLSAYLTVVVHRLLQDFRNTRWGKWRPTVAARRLGEVAVQLERLLYRDGLTLAEAIQTLRTNFRVELSPHQLEEIAAQLPERPRRHFEGDEVLHGLHAPDDPETALQRRQQEETLRRTQAVLAEALAGLEVRERLVLKLHFEQGMPAVQIAQVLQERQRTMYSKIETSLRRLRNAFTRAGLEGDEVLAAMGWSGGTLGLDFDLPEPEDAASAPRKRGVG